MSPSLACFVASLTQPFPTVPLHPLKKFSFQKNQFLKTYRIQEPAENPATPHFHSLTPKCSISVLFTFIHFTGELLARVAGADFPTGSLKMDGYSLLMGFPFLFPTIQWCHILSWEGSSVSPLSSSISHPDTHSGLALPCWPFRFKSLQVLMKLFCIFLAFGFPSAG